MQIFQIGNYSNWITKKLSMKQFHQKVSRPSSNKSFKIINFYVNLNTLKLQCINFYCNIFFPLQKYRVLYQPCWPRMRRLNNRTKIQHTNIIQVKAEVIALLYFHSIIHALIISVRFFMAKNFVHKLSKIFFFPALDCGQTIWNCFIATFN